MDSIKILSLVAMTILVTTGLAVGLAYTPGTQRFTMYSVDDRGPYGLYGMYEAISSRVPTKTLIGSISTLLRENVSNGVLMIIGPYKSFSSDEIASILFLLARGNSLIIANDFGTGNQIMVVISYLFYQIQKELEDNATFYIQKIAFNGSVLMDAVSYYRTPANPVAVNINHDSDPRHLFDGVNSIATYMPTTISGYIDDIANNTHYRSPLPGQAMTTQFSWIETNLESVKDGTYKPDPDEWGGVPFSVITYFPISDHQFLMFVSDPDIFTNRFFYNTRFDNRIFIDNLANKFAQMNATVFIDQAHQPALPLSSVAYISIILHTISYFTLFPVLGIFVPRSIYTYLRRMFPEYEARGILMKKVKRRTAYEFNPDARKALDRNDFTEPLRILLERFKMEFKATYGTRSEKYFESVAKRKKVPKNVIKIFKEALGASERGSITRDQFVLYARRIIELEKLIGVRRYGSRGG